MALRFFVLSSALLLLAVGFSAAFPGNFANIADDLDKLVVDKPAEFAEALGDDVKTFADQEDVIAEELTKDENTELSTGNQDFLVPEVASILEGAGKFDNNGIAKGKENAPGQIKAKLPHGNSVQKEDVEGAVQDLATGFQQAVNNVDVNNNSTDVGVKAVANTDEKPPVVAEAEPKSFFERMMGAFSF